MSGKVPLVKLNNGIEVQMMGYGTGGLREDSGVEAIKTAIDCGYRWIDTAFIYENEKEVGQAIREKISESVITRKEIFLTTKLWGIHHRKVEYGCKKSLENLGLDYIDLYLIHAPISFNYHDDETHWPKKGNDERDTVDLDLLDIWHDMEKLVDAGLVKSIGISNFNSEQVDYILKNCRIKPVINEIESSPGLNQTKIINFCRERGVEILAYSPLGRHNPEKKLPKYFYDEKVNEIASKYNKTPVQVVLRYSIEMGTIPIPKSGNKERMQQNFDIFDFKLSREEMEYLKSFHHPDNRVCKFIFYSNTKNYPFNIEF